MSDATCKTCPRWAPLTKYEHDGFGSVDHFNRNEPTNPREVPTGNGRCRARAPETRWSLRAEHNRGGVTPPAIWPTTGADDWCGEHPDRIAELGGCQESRDDSVSYLEQIAEQRYQRIVGLEAALERREQMRQLALDIYLQAEVELMDERDAKDAALSMLEVAEAALAERGQS